MQAFFEAHWPEARAVADPEERLYEQFAIPRGGLLQLLGPGVFWQGLRAWLRGHRAGRLQGSPRRMPAFFVVRGGRVLARHHSRHSGDHPDWASWIGAAVAHSR